jgi:vitamin B12 transporter
MLATSIARYASAAIVALFLSASTAADASAAATPETSPSPAASPSGALTQIGRVFTSDRRSEPIGETSRPTFVIDRTSIEAYGARTVADALADVPGLESYPYGAFGAQVNYGIRGATSAQTLVLVDGQPVADPTTGATYLNGLSTIGVTRIEVVESGTSTLYGTSASGGVINIITSVPRGAYLAAGDGSFADRDVRASIGNGMLGASYERHVADNDYGFPPFRYGQGACQGLSPCGFAGGVRENAYADESTLRLSAGVPLGEGFRVRARADTSGLNLGIPGQLTYVTPQTTQALETNTGRIEIERERANSTLSLDMSGATARSAFADPAFGEYDVYTGRAQISLKDALVFAHDDLVAGIDLARESGVFGSPATTIPAYTVGGSQSQSAAYVQVGASPLAGSRFTAGLRAENDSPGGSVLAPSLGGVIRVGTLRFAGNLGESFRVPTLEDLYYPGDANPALLPERARVADATVAYDAPRGTLSLGWFGRSGSNFIIAPPPNYLPLNAERAATEGLVLTATSKPFAGLVADVSFTDIYKALDLATNTRLPQNPVGQASLGVTRPFARDRYSYGFRWHVVGSDGDDAASVAGPLTSSYDAYDTLDAFVRFAFTPQAVVSLRGFNLGNEQYAPVFGYPAPGRRIYLELSTR